MIENTVGASPRACPWEIQKLRSTTGGCPYRYDANLIGYFNITLDNNEEL